MSNISVDALDLDSLEKINKLKIEVEKYKQKSSDLEKENLNQKHRIQDLEIEIDHNEETIKNQLGLIKFYKDYRKEQEKKNDQKYLEQYEEKIRSLEDSIAIKDRKIDTLYQELKEQTNLNERLVDVITSKEEIIKKLQKGINVGDGTGDANATKFEEEIDNLKQKISDLESEKNSIIDKYDDKIKELNEENNKYQDKIYDLDNEILNLKETNKKYEIEEVKQRGGPDTDAEVEKLYKEEIENLKTALEEVKESKRQIKEKAQEQRDSDVKETMDLEKALEDLKAESDKIKRQNEVLKIQNKNNEAMNEKLLKRNKELEGIIGTRGGDENLLSNYKAKLDKKNNEIENLTSKCKEFKENLDLYEKDKEERLKEFKHEKEVLQSELDDKSKKLEVALRELNELRVLGGQGEANINQMMEDPKQKLYDEIKECNKQIENKDKEILELKSGILDLKNQNQEVFHYVVIFFHYKRNFHILLVLLNIL